MRFESPDWQDKYITICEENESKIQEWLTIKGGSLLLSGDRGAGKTSLLREIERKNPNNLKFIWLNAIRLGANSDDKEGTLKMVFVLKFLIEELSKLNLPRQRILKDLRKQLYVVEKNISKNTFASIKNDSGELGARHDVSYKWEGFSTIQLSSSLTNYLMKVKDDFKGTSFDQLGTSLWETLKSPFKSIRNFFTRSRDGIVFVFDELDDIENVGELLSLVKKLKSLLTQPYISFIFVTTSEVFFEINKVDSSFYNSGNDKYRTVFSNTLYLRRNSSSELDKYLHNVLKIEDDSEKVFIDFLKIKSRGNIYNLKRNLFDKEYIQNGEHLLNTSDYKRDIVNCVNNVFKIGELVIEDSLRDQYSKEILYLLLYDYLDDLYKYLDLYPQEYRLKRNEFSAKILFTNNDHRKVLNKFSQELFNTISLIQTSDVNGINWGDPESQIVWGDIDKKFGKNFEINSLNWEVTPLYRTFYSKYLEATTVFKSSFGITDITNVEQSRHLIEHGILNDEHIGVITSVQKQGKNKISEGDRDATERAVTLLEDGISKSKRFLQYSGNLLLRKDGDSIEYIEQGKGKVIKLINNTRVNDIPISPLYVHSFEGAEKENFEFTFTFIANNENSVLNVLLFDSEGYTNSVSDYYYNVRLSSGINNVPTSGIMRKEANLPFTEMKYVQSPVKNILKPGEYFDVKIKLESKVLYLYAKNSRNNRFNKSSLLEQYTFEFQPLFHHLVFFNEEGPVEISKLKLT